jgi:hypothetical protein
LSGRLPYTGTWLYERLPDAGEPELVHEQPWSSVWRIPRPGGAAWLKLCRPVQAHEPALTAALARRWPDRAPGVLAADPTRSLLLLEDAGTPFRAFGDAEEAWIAALPLYAELQQGEAAHAAEHLAAGVPDQRLETLPAALEALGEPRLAGFAGRLEELSAALTLAPTVQHDDLHGANVFARDGRVTIIDWGDAVIGHPFATLLVTLRTYDGDPARLRDAYLEAWPRGARDELDDALQLAALTRILSWKRMADATGDPKSYEALEANVRWFLEHVSW